ncbi:tryptophan synthase subunit alpha [Actinomadura sp. NPDC048032]|uniref:tryptophan synthase subunit alpha n=1 Tax=Actinomadura sp. NPDC048032 TaxID=3155747 RepID=UPI0033EC6440
MSEQGGRAWLESVLAAKRERGRPALIGYLPIGHPSVPASIEAMFAMVEAGVDIVEIGLPHDDPVMDGPVIRQATESALRGGTRIADLFTAVTALASAGVPVVCMTYWAPVERYGAERFARDLAIAGGCGAIVPDLPDGRAPEWTASTDAHGLARILVVPPDASDERISRIASACTGFVYAAGRLGLTGSGEVDVAQAKNLVDRVRRVTTTSVCVGFGISTPAHAAGVATSADGVIVGTALVECLAAPSLDAGLERLTTLVGSLAASLHTPSRTPRTTACVPAARDGGMRAVGRGGCADPLTSTGELTESF